MLLCLGYGCSDVLEQDLKDEQVVLKAPVDGLVTNDATQVFWWEALDEPFTAYRIQVVSPSFDSIESLWIDDEVTEGLIYEANLPSGTYQWTVLATNSFSQTTPEIRNLVVRADSTLDLSEKIINLVSPENNFFTSDSTISFLWQSLSQATNYRLQIASPDFTNSSYIVEDVSLETDLYETTLPEGDYQWRVRGENDTSVTPYSTQSFTIDMTVPTTPVLLSPADRDTVTFPAILSWEADQNSARDTLYLYSDSLQTNLVLKLDLTETSYTLNSGDFSRYFWTLRTVDDAGNLSNFSSLRSFFIQE